MPSGVQVASLFGVLDLQDNLTDGLKDAKKSLSSFGNTLDKKLKSVGASMSDLGGSLTTLGAPFLGVAVAATLAWDAWGDATAQTGAVLKSTGNQVGYMSYQLVDLARSLSETTAISKTTILETENMLLTFTNIGHDVFPRVTQAVLDLSVAMGQDTKSSAIQLGKALNDPINGITALTRVGVTFTESQKAMIASLVAAGDIAGAQGIILAEIEREFGGSAEAAAGPIERLQNALNDLATGLGSALEPAVNSVIDAITPFIQGLTDLTQEDAMPEVIGGVLALGAALAIAGPILMAVGASLSAIGTVIAFLTTGVIGPVILAVAALALAFSTNFLGIRDTVQPIIEGIDSILRVFTQGLKDGLDPLQALGMALFSTFGGDQGLAAQNFILSIRTGLSTIGTFITTQVVPALQNLALWFQTEGLPFITTAVNDFITNVWTPAVTTLGQIWTLIQPTLDSVYSWFVTYGLVLITNAVNTFMDVVWNPAVTLISTIWALISPGLGDFLNWFTTDGLPSIITSLTDFKTNAVDPVIDLLTNVWTKVSPALAQLQTWFTGGGEGGGLQAIIGALQPFFDLLKMTVDFIIQLGSIGGQIIGDVANGLNNVVNGGQFGGGAATGGLEGPKGAQLAHDYFNQQNGGSSGFGNALGIPNVLKEGMYHLHPGEEVVPAHEVGQGGSNGMVFTGNITVVANNPQEFETKMRKRYRARGN